MTKDTKLSKIWIDKLEVLDIAFQPILNIHTGKIYAVEALLRNFQEIGYKSIFCIFDSVYKNGLLYSFDLALREKAFKKYTQIDNFKSIKLFYNLDNRLLSMSNFTNGNTEKILKKLDIKKENLCFEISERHEVLSEYDLEKIIQHYKEENISIAIDDFGVGYAGFKLLYHSTPDIIKIDRFFLQNIENNLKKKLMVRSITHLAIQLGIKVVAEGIETQAELLTCRDIGCHFAQGYLIQKPTLDTKKIQNVYPLISEIVKTDKKNQNSESLLSIHVEKIEPILSKTTMDTVIEYFKNNKNKPIVPIVNSNKEPMGLLYESQIKDFLYSPYGMSLLLNKESNLKLKNLLNKCGYADINSSLTTVIELFSNSPESAGIIITKDSKYIGFLSANAIINIINEKNIFEARDQNPLTKLPGNSLIENYINKVSNSSSAYLLCYFDLDNFKAFNDVYGFRNGDRIIQVFADILRKEIPKNIFKAHIGGDDFFIAFKNKNNIPAEISIKQIEHIIHTFKERAKEFYTQEDKDRGYISTKNRDSSLCKFPLLTVSASVLLINTECKNISNNLIHKILSSQKKVAKLDKKKLAVSSLI